MKLKAADRIVLLGILPSQGSFLTLSVADDIRHKLTFSVEEREAIALVEKPDGRIEWKVEADLGKDVSLSEAENSLIAAELKTLNDQKKLSNIHLDIYRRFVLGQE